tara:strand:+ start:1869 stop:2117 length:249 start_codon:yes stop_codon:yes gene_type:complete
MGLKKGDLIELKDGTKAILTSDTYVYRKLDAVDYEMIDNGMGEYAGSYCSAFNIVIPETGVSRRIIYGDHKFTKISNEGENR